MTKTIYCTLVTASALPQALVLRDSLRAQGIADLRILLTEHPAVVAKLRVQFPELKLLSPNQIGCGTWLHLAFAKDAAQFGAALKPALISSLLADANVVYFAPTIEIFSRLDGLEKALSTADFVVTPQVTRPLPEDGKIPSMRDILRAGQFNLDFLAVRASEQSAEILSWWQKLTSDLSTAASDEDPPQPDQFWAAAFASFSDRLHILRSPRYHLSAWNVALHPIEWSGKGAPETTDGPLVFMNFAGLAGDAAGKSPQQNRFVITEASPLQKLIARHGERMAAWRSAVLDSIPYSFGCYTDRIPISDLDRQLFLRLAPPNRRLILNPFTERCFFEEVAMRSPALRHLIVEETRLRVEELERRLNSLPYSLFAHAATVMELTMPGSRDRVYNRMQLVSRRLNSLPHLLFAQAATVMDRAVPGSRDRVYNMLQQLKHRQRRG